MRSVNSEANPATGGDELDLIDVLHDVVDEYDAGNCDLSTLTYEVGAIIIALDTLADPGWLSELGRIWIELRVLRAEQAQARTSVLTATRSASTRALAAQIRQLVRARDAMSSGLTHDVRRSATGR